MDDATDINSVLLCPSCATEVGADTDANSVGPLPGDVSAACEHCGGTLVGFAYRAPDTVVGGMAPGVG